jgi:hypothetical protein
MLGNRKLILDTFCEVHDLLQEYADGEFWDFSTHELVPNAVYLISKKEISKNRDRIRTIVENNLATVIFSNPAEGSETLIGQLRLCNMTDLALTGQLLLLGGGAMDTRWQYHEYASFMPKILDYEENIEAASRSDEIYSKTSKPYKFLFFNGRMRPHRKYLIESFRLTGLLDQSLWTCLDSKGVVSRHVKLMYEGKDLMHTAQDIKYLDPYYEVDRYSPQINTVKNNSFVKYELFQDTWGEIYIKAEPYIDSYFSLVTETVFDYPYSFRTEKIWKPIAMGHPWIAVANCGYYRDMHNQGYRTLGHLLDESFDLIDHSQDRIERIAQVVEDLCRQDLSSFLATAEETCKYNQQRHAEHRIESRNQFSKKFFQFINKHINERP